MNRHPLASKSGYEFLTENVAKTSKGEKFGYLTGILYLSPEKSAGLPVSVCPFASAGCIATCLNTAGRAGIMKPGATTNAILEARKRRTGAFFQDRTAFMRAIHRDVARLVQRAATRGLAPAVRLNGTSDLEFVTFARGLFEAFPGVQFYDYTKNPRRAFDYAAGKLPGNYHVTFSRSERHTATQLDALLNLGVSIAVPYIGTPAAIPETIGVSRWTYVVDGDASDLRFLDGPSRIVALTAKGKAKRDVSGFVVRTGGVQ